MVVVVVAVVLLLCLPVFFLVHPECSHNHPIALSQQSHNDVTLLPIGLHRLVSGAGSVSLHVKSFCLCNVVELFGFF